MDKPYNMQTLWYEPECVYRMYSYGGTNHHFTLLIPVSLFCRRLLHVYYKQPEARFVCKITLQIVPNKPGTVSPTTTCKFNALSSRVQLSVDNLLSLMTPQYK